MTVKTSKTNEKWATPTEDFQINRWGSLDIHRFMLEDQQRAAVYEAAFSQLIEASSSVLDVGSGTGLLALLAARYTEKNVVGLEYSSLCELASRIAKDNNIDNLEFKNKDALHVKKGEVGIFDVVSHELIGGLIFEENMVDILHNIALTSTHSETIFIPSSMKIFCALCEDPEVVDNQIFWSREISGLDFSSVASLVRPQMQPRDKTTVVFANSDNCLVSEPVEIAQYEFGKSFDWKKEIAFRTKVIRSGTFDGILLFYDIDFGVGEVKIVTSPTDKMTNWGQVFVPLDSMNVFEGQWMDVVLQFSRWSKDWCIDISFE